MKGCEKAICSSADELKEYLAKINYVKVKYSSKGPLTISAEDEYPLNISSLGKCSWPLFHNIAYNYKGDSKQTLRFIKAFARFYPCEECRGDFIEQINANAFDLNSNASLAESLCIQHNLVKKKLNQVEYFCCHRSDLLLNPYKPMNSKSFY